MQFWIAGLLAGLAGTVAMSMLMMPMMKGQPSGNQVLWSKIRRIDPMDTEAKLVGMMMHFGYGATWGLAFAFFIDGVDPSGASWLWGLLLGVALMMLAGMIIMPALGMKPEPGMRVKMMMGMLMAHLLYGGVTGAVYGWLA